MTTEALLVGHPDDRCQIGDDQHDVLGHLRPGHRPHAAEHRAQQDAEKAEPDTEFKRDLQRARGDRSGRVDLRRHVGERCDNENDNRTQARRVAAVTGADEVGHRVAAELSQIWCHQRVDEHVTAGPANDEC